jgi:hypothetical protein
MDAGLRERDGSRGAATGRARRRLRPPLVVAALLCVAVAGGAILAWPSRPPQAATVPAPSVAAYRGLAAWIDLYDTAAWRRPAAAVRDLQAHHVRTLFLETSNFGWPTKLNQPAVLARFIAVCHARGLRIVAWYVPDFGRDQQDYRRSLAAISFRTAGGQRFDSFGLDIEASMVKPVSTRNHRLIVLSQRLRDAAGPRYPLGAIIPSPEGMSTNATYWPVFPYVRLAALYDVMLPMGYYTYHGDGARLAYQETLTNVAIIRDETGRPAEPIHVIAGLAAKSSGAETEAFVRAVRETGGMGASIYDWATTAQSDWDALRNVPTNPLQEPALPVDLGYAAPLGACPGDGSHPQEAFFQSAGQDGDRVLRYRVYDAQDGEVRLLVNWQDLGTLPAGPTGAWSDTREVAVPAAALDPAGRNVIGFVARGTYPQWSTWGVRDVELVTP